MPTLGKPQGLEKLVTDLKKLSNINSSEAAFAGAKVLRDKIFENWQRIDPDAPDWQVAVEKSENEIKVIAIPDEGGLPFMEFGTSKMQGKPFIRPAIDNSQDAIKKAIADNIKKQLKEKI